MNIKSFADTSSVVNYYASNACWLKDRALYYGFLLPVAILLLYNFTIFLLVSVELKKQNHRVIGFLVAYLSFYHEKAINTLGVADHLSATPHKVGEIPLSAFLDGTSKLSGVFFTLSL